MSLTAKILRGIVFFPAVPFLALADFFKAPYVCFKTAWMIWKGYCQYIADGSFDFKDIQDYFFSTLCVCLRKYPAWIGGSVR
ncbi:MAG: hypothetical protein ACRCUT_10090 [Spirochaetota bacterium]